MPGHIRYDMCLIFIGALERPVGGPGRYSAHFTRQFEHCIDRKKNEDRGELSRMSTCGSSVADPVACSRSASTAFVAGRARRSGCPRGAAQGDTEEPASRKVSLVPSPHAHGTVENSKSLVFRASFL